MKLKLPCEIIDHIYSFDDNRFLIKSYNLCMYELKEKFGVFSNNYNKCIDNLYYIKTQYMRFCAVNRYNIIPLYRYILKYIKKMKYIASIEMSTFETNRTLRRHLQYYKHSPAV